MRTNVFVPLLPLFLSTQLHASGAAAGLHITCARQVTAAETRLPDFMNIALETLFNGEFRRENGSIDPNDEFAKMETQFLDQISHIRNHVGLMDVNFLPAKFQAAQAMSVNYSRRLDWSKLIGRAITGFQDVHEWTGTPARPVAVRNYFAGTVNDIEENENNLILTLAASDGMERILRIKLDFFGRPNAQIFVLDSELVEERLFRRAITDANFEKIMAEAFGSPLEKSDYEVATAIVETFLHLPQSLGPDSVVDVVLGREIEGQENFTHHGAARGRTRYTEASLKKVIGPIHSFMVATKMIEKDNSPNWFGRIARTARAPLFENYWYELQRKPIPQS